MDRELIYLDHAAATPMDERVLTAMQPYFSRDFFNPSSPYMPAVKVRRDYENAKQTLANLIGAKTGEIVITAGATESINLAFSGISGHVVVPNIEHHSVLACAKAHDNTIVEADERGYITADLIKKAIRPDTQLVSVALANNELGTIQPLRDIAEVIIKLDNHDRSAPEPYRSAPHIEISRRIRRGMGSTFRINGKEVRARDVQLIFADASSG